MNPGSGDTELAVVLRQTQWALDDAAHDMPAGRLTPQRRLDLAGLLDAVAAVMRAMARPLPFRPPPGAENPLEIPGSARSNHHPNEGGWIVSKHEQTPPKPDPTRDGADPGAPVPPPPPPGRHEKK